MKASDVLCWIVIGGATVPIVLMLIWSMCGIARLSDDIQEEQWKEYCARGNKDESEEIFAAIEENRYNDPKQVD